MPLYEYTCLDCGQPLEALQRLGDGAEGLLCSRCGGRRLQKRFSTFAAHAGGDTKRGPSAGGCGAGACGTPGFT